MNPDNLDTLSDTELSEAFAVEVAGWTLKPFFPAVPSEDIPEGPTLWHDKNGFAEADQDGRAIPPPFATSADAVSPWLERAKGADAVRVYQKGANGLVDESLPLLWMVTAATYYATAPTFARAACIALLRASRAEARKESPRT